MLKLSFFSLIFALSSTTSYAYFDPGTGMFIIQGIIAVFGVAFFYLGYPIRLLKTFINNFKKKKNSKDLYVDKENTSDNEK